MTSLFFSAAFELFPRMGRLYGSRGVIVAKNVTVLVANLQYFSGVTKLRGEIFIGNEYSCHALAPYDPGSIGHDGLWNRQRCVVVSHLPKSNGSRQ
jgi:hypothetical protein